VWKGLPQTGITRYHVGLLIANNAGLRVPLLDESRKGYKHRQKTVLCRTGSDLELELESREWANHPETPLGWVHEEYAKDHRTELQRLKGDAVDQVTSA